MQTRTVSRTALALAAGIATGAALLPGDATAQQRNCLDTLAGMQDYSRVVGAITRSHMQNDVRNMQNVTIFAPTNRAIDQVDPNLADRIFPRGESGARDADPLLAAAAVQGHIVQGRFPAAALAQNVRVTTVAGTTLNFAGPSGGERSVTISAGPNVSARVVQADIPCANGVIHGIDSVLIR